MRPTQLLTLALVLGSAGAVRAEAPIPQHQLFYSNITGARLNAIGLSTYGQVGYRYRLYESSAPAFRDNFVGIGLSPSISPAFARIGPQIEVQPLTVLRLFASYELVYQFGTFGQLVSYPSARDDHGDSHLEAAEAAGLNYATSGTVLVLGASVQMKVGPIAARSTFKAYRTDYDLRDGDRAFYDLLLDIMLPDKGWSLTNDADLLFVSDFGLVAGLRYSTVAAFYGDRHLRPGETTDGLENSPIHRLGPIFAYTFFREEGRVAFNSPTLFFLLGWHLQHRYRTGDEVSQALPMIALGFGFSGDLMALTED